MIALLDSPPTCLDDLLHKNKTADLRALEVIESIDEVVIVGTVPSYYLKQVAQELVRPGLLGRRLKNEIRVTAQIS